MELLINKKFKMNNCNETTLRSFGFKKYNILHDKDSNDIYYTYKFPIKKYKKQTVLECKIIVCVSNCKVVFDVYDNDGNIYHHFYTNEYGDAKPILQSINKKILNEFEKLNIVEVKNIDN